MIVLGASALLAFLQGEPGADLVETALEEGAACGAANWSEVAATVRSRGADWGLASALLLSHELGLREVTVADAELAAELAAGQGHLSLGDRLCLALAERLNCDVLTADRAWGGSGRVRQLRPGENGVG